jgi:hypothetical protein
MSQISDRTHPAFTTAPGWAFGGVGHVSHKHRYLFVATPKVACSSIIMTLHRLEHDDPAFAHAQDHDVHTPHLSPLESMAANVSVIHDANYFKWCFVRNPFDRLLSCWKEKLHDWGGMRPMFEQLLGRVGSVSFDEFIRTVCSQEFSDMDSHYAPQAYVTFQGMIPFDFVGRFERLESDLAAAFGKFEADYMTYRAVVDSHRTGPKPYSLITPELEAMIVDKFAVDFASFDYSPRVHDLISRDSP